MTQALLLLISAMQLLTLVSGNPQLPQSFKDSVIIIANRAIAVAQEEINNQRQIVSTPTPAQVQEQVVQATPPPVIIIPTPQSVGAIPSIPMEDKTEIFVRTDPSETTTSFWVNVVDADGNYVYDAPVKFTTPEGLVETRTTSNLSKNRDGKFVNLLTVPRGVDGRLDFNDPTVSVSNVPYFWYNTFNYTPSSKGKKVLTFETLGKTKTIEIVVE